jgi:hypothetical protein
LPFPQAPPDDDALAVEEDDAEAVDDAGAVDDVDDTPDWEAPEPEPESEEATVVAALVAPADEDDPAEAVNPVLLDVALAEPIEDCRCPWQYPSLLHVCPCSQSESALHRGEPRHAARSMRTITMSRVLTMRMFIR